MKVKTQKIVPSLWYDDQAEEAVEFYTGIFENSRIHGRSYYTEAGKELHQKEPDSVMTIDFELAGFRMTALNGGPQFKFNPSISFFVICRSPAETEQLWRKLSEGGEVLMPLDSYEWSDKYGWLQDAYGVNWQLMLEDPVSTKEKIVPLIFFTGKKHGKAEEALNYYLDIFKKTGLEGVMYYGDENPYAKGFVQHVQFQLEGKSFMAMDSGVENDFPFNEAISFIINCKDQQEIDYYWKKLSREGEPQQCGWLKDKFGVSWQVVPEHLELMIRDGQKGKTERMLQAFFQMKKPDIVALEEAYDGGS